MRDADAGKKLERKKGSGRKALINNRVNRQRLSRMFKNRRGVSLRFAARKLNCSHTHVSKILKSFKRPILCFKRIKRQSRTLVQRLVARQKC